MHPPSAGFCPLPPSPKEEICFDKKLLKRPTKLILKNILFLGFQTPSHRSLMTMYPNLSINLAYLFSLSAQLNENERGLT